LTGFVIQTRKSFFRVRTVHHKLIIPSSCSPLITELVIKEYFFIRHHSFGMHEIFPLQRVKTHTASNSNGTRGYFSGTKYAGAWS